METCELTILMPCLNEAETLAQCISKAKSFLQTEHVHGEILIADNGSTDGSQAIAAAAGAKVIHVTARGYGAALKGGIAAAQGHYVIMGDADDSYNFLALKPFLNKLREGYELVMGNRFKGGILNGAMPLLNRYVGNPILSFIGRLFYKTEIGDFHCGLRAFNRNSLLALHLQGDGMEFASEMVVKASLKKLKITEVPTSLAPDGRSRRPHLRPWRDGWRHLRLLLLLSPRWLFCYPGLFLLFLGVVSMIFLSQGPIWISNIQLGIHTMLFSALFMIVGLQAICFALFATFIANYHLKLTQQPPSFLSLFSLERGLLLGLCLMCIGGSGAVYTFWYWQHHHFGNLIPEQMMRILIPALTIFILGIQSLFASFFMSLLDLYYARE